MLFFAQFDWNMSLYAFRAENCRHAQANIFYAKISMHHCRNRQDRFLIPNNAFTNAADRHRNAVIRRMLLRNNIIRTVLDLFCDLLFIHIRMHMTAHFQEIIQRNTGNIGAAPSGNLTVSVLSDDKRVNIAAVNIQMLTQCIL